MTDGREDDTGEYVRVVVRLTGHRADVERLWSRPLGNNLYEVCNSPFCATFIHAHDIVLCHTVETEIRFVRVLQQGGWSLLHVAFDLRAITPGVLADVIQELEAMGGEVDLAPPSKSAFLALGVPPEKAVSDFLAYLASLPHGLVEAFETIDRDPNPSGNEVLAN